MKIVREKEIDEQKDILFRSMADVYVVLHELEMEKSNITDADAESLVGFLKRSYSGIEKVTKML